MLWIHTKDMEYSMVESLGLALWPSGPPKTMVHAYMESHQPPAMSTAEYRVQSTPSVSSTPFTLGRSDKDNPCRTRLSPVGLPYPIRKKDVRSNSSYILHIQRAELSLLDPVNFWSERGSLLSCVPIGFDGRLVSYRHLLVHKQKCANLSAV
jgi:hypothetical protein